MTYETVQAAGAGGPDCTFSADPKGESVSREVIITAQSAHDGAARRAGIGRQLQRLQAVMFGQMRISRVAGQIKVTFGAESAASSRPVRAAKPNTANTAAVTKKLAPRDRGFALMVGELSISLSANPRNRANLRYLVKLEASLLELGVDALEEITLAHCRKARRQLDTLMAVAPSPGLRDLAARLDVVILIRDVDVRSGPDSGPTDFGTYTGPRSAAGPVSDFHIGGVAL